MNRNSMRDVAYSVGGLLLFNCTIQFVIYPLVNRRIGDEQFGIFITLLSVISILAGSAGTGANYSRMIMGLSHTYTNGDYNGFLLLAGAACVAGGTGYLVFIRKFSPFPAALFGLLMCLTLLRYYGDVEFRLAGNFRGYLAYYVLIALGYCAGIPLFLAGGQWAVLMIVGELAAVIFVGRVGSIFRPPFFETSPNRAYIWKSALILSVTELITNVILFADRLLILTFVGGVAVTAFYVASLFGKTLSMITGPLNSVIISHLVRYKGALTKKAVTRVFLVLLGLGAVAFGACLAVTPVFIRLFYPTVYRQAAPLLWSAILGQVFFFLSNVMLTILLRFWGEKYQLYITVFYAALFFALTIPALIWFGLLGFSYAVLIVNAVKLAVCYGFGFIKSEGRCENG